MSYSVSQETHNDPSYRGCSGDEISSVKDSNYMLQSLHGLYKKEMEEKNVFDLRLQVNRGTNSKSTTATFPSTMLILVD